MVFYEDAVRELRSIGFEFDEYKCTPPDHCLGVFSSELKTGLSVMIWRKSLTLRFHNTMTAILVSIFGFLILVLARRWTVIFRERQGCVISLSHEAVLNTVTLSCRSLLN